MHSYRFCGRMSSSDWIVQHWKITQKLIDNRKINKLRGPLHLLRLFLFWLTNVYDVRTPNSNVKIAHIPHFQYSLHQIKRFPVGSHDFLSIHFLFFVVFSVCLLPFIVTTSSTSMKIICYARIFVRFCDTYSQRTRTSTHRRPNAVQIFNKRKMHTISLERWLCCVKRCAPKQMERIEASDGWAIAKCTATAFSVLKWKLSGGNSFARSQINLIMVFECTIKLNICIDSHASWPHRLRLLGTGVRLCIWTMQPTLQRRRCSNFFQFFLCPLHFSRMPEECLSQATKCFLFFFLTFARCWPPNTNICLDRMCK